MNVLRCQSCGAPVPLLDGVAFSCPYCTAAVKVPPDIRKLFELHAVEADAQRQLEQRFATVSKAPSWRVDVAAAALVLLLPAVAAVVVMTVAKPAIVDAFAAAIVPALLPGTALWIWTASIHATIVRFQLALACRFDAGNKICRECGAPLDLRPNAISAHCAYCGTDSLIEGVVESVARLDVALGAELRTLAQANAALAIRRRLVLGGAAIACALLGALVVLLVVGFG